MNRELWLGNQAKPEIEKEAQTTKSFDKEVEGSTLQEGPDYTDQQSTAPSTLAEEIAYMRGFREGLKWVRGIIK